MLLLLLAPLLALIVLLIMLDSPGSAIYRQERRGRFGSIFTIVKFRTMFRGADAIDLRSHNVAEAPLFKLGKNDPRLTRVGRVLRPFALDELPQLWNVLVGEMSLVGPRPLVLDEADRLPAWAGERRLVRPGLTGPWQAAGPHTMPLARMLELDCGYSRDSSLLGDLRILGLTITRLVLVRGVH